MHAGHTTVAIPRMQPGIRWYRKTPMQPLRAMALCGSGRSSGVVGGLEWYSSNVVQMAVTCSFKHTSCVTTVQTVQAVQYVLPKALSSSSVIKIPPFLAASGGKGITCRVSGIRNGYETSKWQDEVGLLKIGHIRHLFLWSDGFDARPSTKIRNIKQRPTSSN